MSCWKDGTGLPENDGQARVSRIFRKGTASENRARCRTSLVQVSHQHNPAPTGNVTARILTSLDSCYMEQVLCA